MEYISGAFYARVVSVFMSGWFFTTLVVALQVLCEAFYLARRVVRPLCSALARFSWGRPSLIWSGCQSSPDGHLPLTSGDLRVGLGPRRALA